MRQMFVSLKDPRQAARSMDGKQSGDCCDIDRRCGYGLIGQTEALSMSCFLMSHVLTFIARQHIHSQGCLWLIKRLMGNKSKTEIEASYHAIYSIL